MRVLLVSQEFPPETGWGGIGTYAGIIAPALVRAGAEVHVLSVVAGQKRSTRRDEAGVWVHRAPLVALPGIGRLLPLTWSRLSLAAAVAREHRRLGAVFDVIECPEWNAEGFVFALRRRAPLVVRLHSSGAQVFPYIGPLDRDRRAAVRVEDGTIRRADLVTGTDAQIQSVRQRLGLAIDGLRTITYPVRLAVPSPLPEGGPRICFAGRFEKRKGPDTLIRAMPKVLASLPEATLVLVGRGCRDSEHADTLVWLRSMARDLGVDHAVEFVERWGTDAVAEELSRSTVSAVPSRWESFGYVAAEAGALGRAVVASDIPALSDVVVDGETGRLVPPGDYAGWADALIEVLSDPDRTAAMGRAATVRIRAMCDPDRIAGLTLDAYDHALARFRRRGTPKAVSA